MQKYRSQLTSILKYPGGVVNVHMCLLRNSSAHHHFAKMALWR